MNLHYFKPEKAIMNFIILLMFLSIGSCSKTPDVIVNTNHNTNTDPAQYGSPFTGVPDARDAVIYQVNMRCFSSTHNFQGVISRLDSIKNLGVNVIYLMPVYPVGILKSVNSPYCVRDYKAVNAEFGTLTDLRELIDGAHTRGITVILDWVANHTAWDNAWISNPGWYVENSAGVIQSPGGYADVAQLNFQNSDMRAAMITAMKYWVYTANCDGFRCDYADGPPADFWKQAIDTLRNIKTHRLLMLAEGTRNDHYASGFNYTFGFRYYGQLKSVFGSNQSGTTIDNINSQEFPSGNTDMNLVVRYLTNHDVNSSDGTPLDLFGGKTGSLAAFVVTAYMKGVPMIYNGQEVGTPNRLTFPFTNQQINWTLNPSMVAEYKKIIAFRTASLALRRGTLVSYDNTNICAFTKTSGTETVFVISNLRNSTVTFPIPTAIANMVWKDAFTGNAVTLTNQITLSPYSYMVLKN
jgi:glycosidase